MKAAPKNDDPTRFVLFGVRKSYFLLSKAGVSANGEIYPCALHVGRPQSKLGNIYSGIDWQKQKAFRTKFSASGQTVCKTCWNRTLCGGGCSAMVDRFGHEDCRSLMAESECAISIFHHLREKDKTLIYGLVSPKIVKWINGDIVDAENLLPTEPAAEKIGIRQESRFSGPLRDSPGNSASDEECP
jgi:radical SAM protein with 4Fe4S-binding SPASM domain